MYLKKHASVVGGAGILLFSMILSWLLYQDIHPVLFVVFFGCLTLLEVFAQLRWRLSLPCPTCGFDPVLYLKDPSLAARRVVGFVEEKKRDPVSLLRPDPLRHLQKRL